MRFRDDQRGVTVQIGAVLLFATIVVALAMYQATVVPAQNEGVEYRHSQQVQNQMTDVRNAILQTAASGNTRPTSVTLGTQYPSRVFLVNPPPAAGTLTTGSYGNDTIQVSNVNATNDETAEFLDGSWNASTKYLSYRPDYYEYADAPSLVYGGTLLYNHYPEANALVPLTDQLLVRGDTITLLALNGSVDTSRVGSVSVSPTPVSAPYTEVQVEAVDDSESVTVTVPTRLSASTLENMTGLDDRAKASVVDAGENRVTIRLNGSGPYTLQTAKLGVGSGVTDEGARYLTTDDGDVVRTGETFTVSVRDRFHNPVAGAATSIRVNTSLVERVSEQNGRVTFRYTGSGGDLSVSIPGGEPEHEVIFDGREGASGGESGDGSEILEWNTTRIEASNSDLGISCWVENDTCQYVRQGSGTETVSLVAEYLDGRAYANVDYAVNNTTVVTDLTPSTGESNATGINETVAGVGNPGTARVYVTSSNGKDELRLVAKVQEEEETSDPSVKITGISSVGNSGKFDVSWAADANGDGDLSSVTVSAYSWDSPTLSETEELSGESAAGTTRLDGEPDTYYYVVVTVTDEQGRTGLAGQSHAT